MSIYIVTGKLGSGKTLLAVSRVQVYLRAGRRVATNLDLDLGQLMGPGWSGQVERLPDYPTAADLWRVGRGAEGAYDESRFGLLVLDEGARWLNSRDWNSAARRELIEWCLHARKLRWDLYILIQDVDMLDKQVRGLLAEHVVVCRRLDRLRLFGIGLPRVHIGTVYYGESPGAGSLKVDRWWYRGVGLYRAYDTSQVFGRPHGGWVYVGARYVSSAGRRGALEVLGVLVLFPARLWLAGMLLAAAAFQGVSWERVARRWGVVGRRDAVRRPQLDYRMLTDALARS